MVGDSGGDVGRQDAVVVVAMAVEGRSWCWVVFIAGGKVGRRW